jgi:hypothetical protein
VKNSASVIFELQKRYMTIKIVSIVITTIIKFVTVGQHFEKQSQKTSIRDHSLTIKEI